ncbi:MAG TPA: hypothetical protein VJ183_08305 [Chloroflexia bacterium]|nr:hypothetical protein [Chloroflexia bacterium]
MATQEKDEKPKSNGRRRKGEDEAGLEGETGKPGCFVIMPISTPDGYEPGHFDRVYEDIFVPACDQAGFRAIRADQVKQTNLIHLDVLQKLVESPMALCDLSNRNPNVLFELGLRQAFDKPVVLVQEVGTPAIFDIAPLRYTTYRSEMKFREVLLDQAAIAASIRDTLKAAKDPKNVNSLVKLLAISQPASLPDVKEAEKDPVLQLVRAEIDAVRSQVSALANWLRRIRVEDSKPVDSRLVASDPEIEYTSHYQSLQQQFLALLLALAAPEEERASKEELYREYVEIRGLARSLLMLVNRKSSLYKDIREFSTQLDITSSMFDYKQGQPSEAGS